jgi:uncharacterized membrane protein YkoI
MKSIKTKWVVPLAALVLTLSIGGAAFAATGSSSTDTTAAGTVTTAASTATTAGSTATTAGSTAPAGAEKGWGQQRTDETLLTGDVLAKVQAAALAKIGSDATVVRAETDADGNAKYEVHAVKADGTRVTVYVDESYNVVSVQTCTGPAGRGGMMGGRSDETALTGDTLAKVQAAALAAAGTGSTLMRAETDADGVAKYEAHVVKADGTHVIVYLDESFKVVKTEAGGTGRGGMMGGRGHGGQGGCIGGTSTTTGASTTGGTITNN